jgi:hypothetical protein
VSATAPDRRHKQRQADDENDPKNYPKHHAAQRLPPVPGGKPRDAISYEEAAGPWKEEDFDAVADLTTAAPAESRDISTRAEI